ncbi:MAG: hypothetical protein KF836_01455 [Fimbriimonadaceae bacterium]|nr:hypothetical protein [Fimbriimonadaceae bacterium]
MSRTTLVRVHDNNFDLRADEIGLSLHHRVAVLGNFGGKAGHLEIKGEAFRARFWQSGPDSLFA